jgi:hypothetical protein
MLRLFRPAVLIAGAFGLLVATAGSTEAGWFSWFRETDTRQLEQSLDVAREAARVASQAAEAQAQQAAAQADQNPGLSRGPVVLKFWDRSCRCPWHGEPLEKREMG